jgi:cytochrome P450
MDKAFWGDPETFRPERFLDYNMSIIHEERVLGAFGYGE